MSKAPATPVVDIGALFGAASAGRDAVDRALMAVAAGFGFIEITGLPRDVPVDAATRRTLLAPLTAPEAESWRRLRQVEDGRQGSVYRG